MRFTDRRDAGRRLAPRVAALNLTDPVVLALPRGGVPVAAPIAAALAAPLEVFVARKVGLPEQPEFGIGAIAEGLAEPVVYAHAPRIRERTWRELTAAARTELERRVARYRGDRALPPLAGAEVVLVDDGLATGVTAEASVRGLRSYGPARVVLAVPVAAPDTAERLAAEVDDLIAILTPRHFEAVGIWYEDYRQTGDDEVLALLAGAAS
ncbi:phosphoribosyltransferase [Sporichthya polymorpha]|uniref:phosphoribosyltransferase n=1 Tax=Sporichthya polymorpha TaxID=35751 RepID=UPI00037BDF6C|nr:phosphoribosyltransferase family protein [Sporichthya polymorpha]